MHRKAFINPIVRTSVVIAILLMLLTGVTFAALQSQTKITSSNITTTNANMQISQNGTTFTSSVDGYNFGEIVPGGAYMPASGYAVYLKNGGGSGLAPTLAVSSTPTNPSNVDLTKVNIIMTSAASGEVQIFSLQSLIDAHATGGLALTSLSVLFPGQTYQFKMQASMAKDAFVGSSASIGAIDFTLTGTAVN